MNFPRIKDPNRMICLGMIFLPLALISLRYLHRVAGLPEDPADAISGFFLGISIGLMLLGVWLNGRRSGRGGDRCARR